MSIHTVWTGLGTIAGYLAILLGLSFYLRKRVGPKLWRKAHRATVAVYLLGLIHALGAGSDTSTAWFRIWAAGHRRPDRAALRLPARRRAQGRETPGERVKGPPQAGGPRRL